MIKTWIQKSLKKLSLIWTVSSLFATYPVVLVNSKDPEQTTLSSFSVWFLIFYVFLQMNDAEQASTVVFVSLDGLVVSVINSGYQEVALLSVSSQPAVWEVEVNNRWKILNVELQTWLEDQWRNKQGQTNLQEQFEVGYIILNLFSCEITCTWLGCLLFINT